jgi:hypothetical protein
VRTLAFPPKQKHLGAIRRGFTRQPAGAGDIQTILAEFHNAQNAATRDEMGEAESSIESADGNAAETKLANDKAALTGADGASRPTSRPGGAGHEGAST